MTPATRACVAAALMVALGGAHASDAEGEIHGYTRIGIGPNKSSGELACFGLEYVPKYRLGNECDFIGEISYTRELFKTASGASVVGTAMLWASHPKAHIADSTTRLTQALIEVKNLGALSGGTAWAGKRYYNRPDIYVLDFKYVVMDGVGAGIDSVPWGPGKFSYGFFRNDVDKTRPAKRHTFTYQDWEINPKGFLKFDATVIRPDPGIPNLHGGWSVSVTHKQKELFGGDNAVALQYGVGPGMLVGGTGDLSLGSNYTRTRLLDQWVWQPLPEWIGTADFVVQRDKTPLGTNIWTTIGTRPIYVVNDHVKLQLDIGHDWVRPAGGGPTQQLTKITFAPTLAAKRDFWGRPELRAFVTYARWNKAAQAAAPAGSTLSTSGPFGATPHGVTMGMQFEVWF